MELLILFFGLDIDVGAVGYDVARLPVLRLVAHRMELEPDLETTSGIRTMRMSCLRRFRNSLLFINLVPH